MIEAFFTIASNNYLAQVQTLFSSVRTAHPESKRILILLGPQPNFIDSFSFDIINVTSLNIEHFADMATRYSVMECSTAVKPSAFLYFFDTLQFNNIVYLDPDIFVYARLDLVTSLFASNYDIILTPHITSYIDDGYIPNELSFSQSGQYNLGFLAARATEEVKGYMAWWARRLVTHAGSDPKSGTFTDQKWCDSIPSFLTNYFILKHNGYNVAYWNMYQRPLTNCDDVWHVGSDLLVFFHFSGISFFDDTLISKHQNRLVWSNIGLYQTLFIEYRRLLLLHNWTTQRLEPYIFDYVGDMSCKISPIIRSLYNHMYPTVQWIDFSSQKQFLEDMCHTIPFSQRGLEKPLNQLQYFIYINRLDLQLQFVINNVKDRERFHLWFERIGSAEYELSDEFLHTHQTKQRLTLGSRILRIRYRLILGIFLLLKLFYNRIPPKHKFKLKIHFYDVITWLRKYM